MSKVLRMTMIALAVTATAGCSGKAEVAAPQPAPPTVPKQVLEKQVTDMLEQKVGQRPDAVTCPGPEPEAGDRARCELSVGADRLGLTAIITAWDGKNGHFEVEVDQQKAK